MASVERCIVLITLVLVVHCGEHIVNGVITDVRLVGGPTSNKGTVEIRQNNGSWETTCGENLGINDVIFICKQLGFTGASRAVSNTSYGRNSSPTTALNCIGDEANLTECTLFSHQTCPAAGAASCHGEGYLGCFMDRSNDRVLFGDIIVAEPVLTISYCIEFCMSSISANYLYAGVGNGDECFCGEISDDYARHGVGSDVNCQIPCAGDPTESCGGVGYIAVFRILQPTPPPTTVADMSQTTTTTTTTTSTPSTFTSASGHLDINTVFRSTPPPTTVADTSSTFATTSGQLEVNTEVASTLAVGILLAFVTLYGIIITLMYLHLRRSNIALKQSVSDRVGQELDPYTSLDATTMKQPAYEDIKATRHGNSGHTNAIEGVEYENQTIIEQTARVKKSNLGVADENTEPEYELPIEK